MGAGVPRAGVQTLATSGESALIRRPADGIIANLELELSRLSTWCGIFTVPTMFRTAARSFATSARRGAESIGSVEAAQQTALNISKAQGIGQRGFLDGKIYVLQT